MSRVSAGDVAERPAGGIKAEGLLDDIGGAGVGSGVVGDDAWVGALSLPPPQPKRTIANRHNATRRMLSSGWCITGPRNQTSASAELTALTNLMQLLGEPYRGRNATRQINDSAD